MNNITLKDEYCLTIDIEELVLSHLAHEVDISEWDLLCAIVSDLAGCDAMLRKITIQPPFDEEPDAPDLYTVICGWIMLMRSDLRRILAPVLDILALGEYRIVLGRCAPGRGYATIVLSRHF